MARPKSNLVPHQQQFVGTKGAAAILGISVSSVQKMVNSGKLQAWRTEGGHRRLTLSSLQQVARELDVPPLDADNGSQLQSVRPKGLFSVLVVEDNPVQSKALTRILDKYGDRVKSIFTVDGAQALMTIAEEMPALVITDLAMQPFDGFHLIRVLRNSQKHARTPVLVITGLTDDEIVQRGGVDSNTTVYHKPLSADRLSGFVDAMLQMHVL